MCFEGNSAPLSAAYLNSQLAILWQNAVDCARDEDVNQVDLNSHEFHKSRYTRALAYYHHIGERTSKTSWTLETLPFYAVFDKPDLQFICNHEAIISLTVQSGHLRLDLDGKVNGASQPNK